MSVVWVSLGELGTVLQDVITVSPDKLPNYEMKIRSFFEEHIHSDEEIRFVLDGSGEPSFKKPERWWSLSPLWYPHS